LFHNEKLQTFLDQKSDDQIKKNCFEKFKESSRKKTLMNIRNEKNLQETTVCDLFQEISNRLQKTYKN